MNDRELLKSIFFEPNAKDSDWDDAESDKQRKDLIKSAFIFQPEHQFQDPDKDVEDIIKDQLEGADDNQDNEKSSIRRVAQLYKQMKDEKKKRIEAKEQKIAEQKIADQKLNDDKGVLQSTDNAKLFVEYPSMAIGQALLQRLTKRVQVKRCVIYPETAFKVKWEYFITM